MNDLAMQSAHVILFAVFFLIWNSKDILNVVIKGILLVFLIVDAARLLETLGYLR